MTIINNIVLHMQKNKGSCLNRKLLEKLALILNENPNCEKIDKMQWWRIT